MTPRARILLGCGAALFAAIFVLRRSHAAPSPARASIEVWGVGAADTVTVDDAVIAIHGGAPSRFVGDAAAPSPPVHVDVAPGAHHVVVRIGDCPSRAFDVDARGAFPRAVIVTTGVSAVCNVPLLPPKKAPRKGS